MEIVEWLKLGASIANFLITGFISYYLYNEKKNDTTNRRIADLESNADSRLDDLSRRVALVEGAMQQLPKHSDLDGIGDQLNKLARETSAQTATLTALEKQVGRIQEWLMEKAK